MHLLAFGSNGNGQLGINNDKDTTIPKKCIFRDLRNREVTLNCGIARIVSGGNHTLVHLQNGEVFATGMNDDGRCGVNSLTWPTVLTFKQVTIEQVDSGMLYTTFKHVAATWETSFFVTNKDWDEEMNESIERVFVAGSGQKGELAIGKGWTECEYPLRIPYFPDYGTTVVAIAGGVNHVVAALSNGEAWGWGACRKGQLGESLVKEKYQHHPEKIEGVPFNVTDVTCGREFTVLIGNKEAGEFMILGAAGDNWKILDNAPSPSAIAGFKSMHANWHGVYVLQGDQSILAWGRNDRGQMPPADLRRTKMISAGSEHGIGLREDGELIAFGWGEHGNCGPLLTDERGKVMASFALRPEPPSIILGVWAGCATSFVLFS